MQLLNKKQITTKKKSKSAALSKTKLLKMKTKTMKIKSPFIRKQTLQLREKILDLVSSSIEIQKIAMKSLSDADKKTALKVLKLDDHIDLKYNDLLRDSTFLLTQQPLARELRRVIGYIQIAKNLEWIGDCAVEIAKFIISFKGQISVSSQKRIETIHKLLYKSMLKLNKIILEEDTKKALALAKLDDEIDATVLTISSSLIKSITHKSKINLINERVYILKIIDALEASGDHVVDICEIIIYIETGTLHGLE